MFNEIVNAFEEFFKHLMHSTKLENGVIIHDDELIESVRK